MTERFMVGASTPRALVQAAAAVGVDVRDLFVRHGFDPERLRDVDVRVPHELVVALWREIPRRTGDDAFGLRVAQGTPPGAFEGLYYAMAHAATLGEAYRTLVRYQRFIHDGTSFAVEVDGAAARLRQVWAYPEPLPRHCNEAIVALWLVRGRQCLREEWAPHEVRFPHPAPADTRPHERLFRAPVRFNQPCNELIFDRALLDRTLPAADAALSVVLDRLHQVLHDKLPVQEGFLDGVRRLLLEDLSVGVPEAEVMARRLGLSKRSFFRRLREHGTSYQQVIDGLRRDLTLRQLEAGQQSLSEIAFMLGFSEVSTFHRAFRRWTGQSPAMYRRSLASEPAASM